MKNLHSAQPPLCLTNREGIDWHHCILYMQPLGLLQT